VLINLAGQVTADGFITDTLSSIENAIGTHRAANALRASLKERALWDHPLVITGEAAGGGALPLPFPTPAQAPTLRRATEARITSDIFFILGDPGQVASSCI
jgi:hypothetical protein